MDKWIVYEPDDVTRLVISDFWPANISFVHIVWTGDTSGRYSVYKNGALDGYLEGIPVENTKRKYMWFGRNMLVTDLFLTDGTYSYIRFWQGKVFSVDEVQQLYEAKDGIHTASPTVTSSPTASPTTAKPTISQAPTLPDIFAPTSLSPTSLLSLNRTTQNFFVVSTFEELRGAIALLTDNAIIEIDANIAVTETLLLSGGYTNVTIRSTPGSKFTLVRAQYHFFSYILIG